MKDYEDGLYQEWVESVSTSLPTLLKRPLLAKPETPVSSTTPTSMSRSSSKNVSKAEEKIPLPSCNPLYCINMCILLV